jgi:hypothetical protein
MISDQIVEIITILTMDDLEVWQCTMVRRGHVAKS